VVGVRDYVQFSQLPNSMRDAGMMAHVLKAVAGFDEVATLIDPDQVRLAEAIELLFADRARDDLVLLYYSGHGVKDERGQLFLAVPQTRKHASGELVRASAVPCRHVHDTMSASRSRRQVVILDCCFSGAFAEGMLAKDAGHVDLRAQLGGEGRVVLASSGSTQYSFDASDTGLSTYTQFLVHGIASGEADLNHDGLITIDELHEYARVRVQAVRPAMSPQILPTREGYSIVISSAQKVDPQRAYAAKVREVADRSGVLSRVAVQVLALRREQLGLGVADAIRIETTELAPLRNRASARADLRKAVFQARRRRALVAERPLLNELRVALNLGEGDLQSLVDEPLSHQRRLVLGWLYWPERLLVASVAVALVVGAVAIGTFLGTPEPAPASPSPPSSAPTTPGPSASPTRGPDAAPSTGPATSSPRPSTPSDPVTPSGETPSNPDIFGDAWVTALACKYDREEALHLAKLVAAETIDGRRMRPQVVHHGNVNCVLIGPFSSEWEAQSQGERARPILNQGVKTYYMPRWCTYLGPQYGGVRQCSR
jgi:uncharacterized caspase-like protein